MADLQVLPQPTRRVPIWVGGASTSSLERALAKGAGWHGLGTPEQLAPSVAWLRSHGAPESFVLSARTDWDGLATDPDVIRKQLNDYAELGIRHVIGVPTQRDADSWLRSVDALASLVAAVS